MKVNNKNILSLAILSAIGSAQTPVFATNTSLLLEEVVVTATKKASGISVQDVPVAVTAYNEDQLEILNVRDLQSLTYSMPNVAMDDIGTSKGTANFTFRGLGINSSIPSIDPTVGVFVDGVYLGINSGVVFDQFDLGGIEVLRGPQGLLFGRNVTGGAVLIKTKDPSSEFEGSVKASVETGVNTYLMGSVSGPLIEDKLLGKLAVYRNDDDGWFTNSFDGSDHGQSETEIYRGALTYLPYEGGTVKFKYEHGSAEGDGPASQNTRFFDRNSFDFSVDETGFFDNEWDMVSLDFTTDLGPGVLTNIFGWRDYAQLSRGDIDGFPGGILPGGGAFVFHSPAVLEAEQISFETRYNVNLGEKAELTVGLYYFDQDINYVEQRELPNNIPYGVNGGGTQDQQTSGAFATIDWQLIPDKLVLTTGARYTKEEKEVQVAKLDVFNGPFNQPCSIEARVCNDFSFSIANGDNAEEDWSNVSPKIGLQWFIDDHSQAYVTWTKGFRSGGFNLRNTAQDPTAVPGPFNEEEQTSFELGYKMDALDGQLRFNAAVFHNTIDDMQRELNVPDEVFGVTQVIRNSADATIQGIELELTAALGDNIVLGLNYGYLDGEYDVTRFDINGNAPGDAVGGPQLNDPADLALDLPRLAPETYGVNLTWQGEVGSNGNTLLARASLNHRDESAYTDNNLGQLNAVDSINANITYTFADGAMRVSIFGRNLSDEVNHGGDTQASFGSFSPLAKGRTYGAEVAYDF